MKKFIAYEKIEESFPMPKKELENEAIEKNQPKIPKAQAMQGLPLRTFYQHLACFTTKPPLESEQCVNLPHLCKFPTCLHWATFFPWGHVQLLSLFQMTFQSFWHLTGMYLNYEPMKSKPNTRYGTKTSAILQKNTFPVLLPFFQSNPTLPPNPFLTNPLQKKEDWESNILTVHQALGKHCLL